MDRSSNNVSRYEHELTTLKNDVNATALEYFFYLFIFCLSAIFPFYVYLNKVNKIRDESVSMFPVTNHIYKTVKLTYFMFFSSISLFYIGFFLVGSFVLSLILIFTACLILFALHIITQVTQQIISLLAIRKFTIHFFPSSIQSVIKVQGWLLCNYWLFHVGFLLKELLRVIFMIRYQDSCEKDFRFDKILYLAFNIFHIASALLYVAVSFRMKERNTESLKKNKPQRLIVWQTKIIMIFKLVSSFF
ncbi:hypothetical protein CAEBREN_03460 [Caenorhabditis brenneri]|uniref:Uncharacterized protein n=1 Tax=Caenorhabditis brenneri TaxID=135651 RepID=G0PAU5_CAEBE|nr:hypothetical protein CAEBREN_03460 [Caenorhabditis brenneri]